MKIQFTEKQKFTQWWFWGIFIVPTTITCYACISELFFDIPFGNKPMSNSQILTLIICSFGCIYFSWYLTLITEINEIGIQMRFVPFVKKSIAWNQIASLKIVNYGFVGYGIRMGSPHGTVYNMKGNMEVALVLKDGTKFVIGTQQHEELRSILESTNSNLYNAIQ